ncbi:Zn-ribbon domain-containing OB-fold protein [Dactylosporangium sp. NPDC005572]|uniref:Zn-ribbon domain-containing OB-fold protein n=1 Tax=Dactylosporangium sp. NPDC005572 TaxID=3156889 RepID=UPI0033AADD8C
MTPPAPVVSDLAAPYWAAAQERRLVLQRCDHCDHWHHFPIDRCPACGRSDSLVWREVSGAGTVYTFSVVHGRAAAPGFTEATPYVIAWIDLEEGARAFGNVVGGDPSSVHIGMPVHVVFEEREGFGLVPNFGVVA